MWKDQMLFLFFDPPERTGGEIISRCIWCFFLWIFRPDIFVR